MKRIAEASATCHDADRGRLLAAACRAALSGGHILRSLYDQPHTITMKGVTNLVTEADFASEKALFEALAADTPEIPVMGEEDTSTHSLRNQKRYWVVDPLDGTTNFAHGFPFFAVSVGLLDLGQPLIAAIHAPMTDELFWASRGGGAWLNGRPVTVSDHSEMIEALVGTGFPYEFGTNLAGVMKRLETVLTGVRDIRRAGAAALDLAYVACGRLDGFYETDLQPWDTAAGWLLVEEAGGRVSSFSGTPYSVFLPEIVASNSRLHQPLIDLLR